MKIQYKNKAKCRNCGDIVESTYRHDMVACSCYQAGEKALTDYKTKHHFLHTIKRIAGSVEIEWPVYNEEALRKDQTYLDMLQHSRGFTLDGGNDYHKCIGNFKDCEYLKEPLEGLNITKKQVQDTY